jgi:hypothetical protein
MLKRDEVANKNSCLNKAREDEPIFVLRANDPIAPAMVRLWASTYRDEKMAQRGGPTQEQSLKWAQANKLADDMEAWRKEHG